MWFSNMCLHVYIYIYVYNEVMYVPMHICIRTCTYKSGKHMDMSHNYWNRHLHMSSFAAHVELHGKVTPRRGNYMQVNEAGLHFRFLGAIRPQESKSCRISKQAAPPPPQKPVNKKHSNHKGPVGASEQVLKTESGEPYRYK